MKRVERTDILSNAEYERQRDAIRARTMATKAERRVHLGEHLTFLFENADTVRYQVQEMLRLEKRTDEESVRHELETYNELLGEDGELGCTLLIEIEDALQRDIVLRKWRALPAHLYLRLADGSQARARFDERQVGDDKLSSVQFLKFRCGRSAPAAIGVDLPAMELEVALTEAQRRALASDLES